MGPSQVLLDKNYSRVQHQEVIVFQEDGLEPLGGAKQPAFALGSFRASRKRAMEA